MRYTVTTRVNIETAPHDPDDTAAELTDSIHHWITDAYGRTDDHFGHNAVTVDSVAHAETRPRDEAMQKLRDLYDQITASEQRRSIALEEVRIGRTADYRSLDVMTADHNEERAEDLDALREAVRVLLGVLA